MAGLVYTTDPASKLPVPVYPPGFADDPAPAPTPVKEAAAAPDERATGQPGGPTSEVSMGVSASGSAPTPNVHALTRNALGALLQPYISWAQAAQTEFHQQQMGVLSDAMLARQEKDLAERQPLYDAALQAMRDFREGLQQPPPHMETLRRTPPVPDMKVRPWLDPEGKSAIQMIGQTLSMLATGIGGLVIGAPKTALKQFREAAELWRQDEVDAATSKFKEFQSTLESVREDNVAALAEYDRNMKEYGANQTAKQAAIVVGLQAIGLSDAATEAATKPLEMAYNFHKTAIQLSDQGLTAASKLLDVMAKLEKSKADASLYGSAAKALGGAMQLEYRASQEKNPEVKADLMRRASSLRQYATAERAAEAGVFQSRVGLTETAKLLPTWLQQSQNVQRFQARLGSLYAAYQTLDQAGLLPPNPTTLAAWSTWAAQQNPEAWQRKGVQEAIGAINTFFGPQTVGFDRTMLDDKGARFQQAYGTALKTPLMPLREFRGIARVWTEETDHVKSYLTMQGDWLKKMAAGSGLSVPDLTPPEEE